MRHNPEVWARVLFLHLFVTAVAIAAASPAPATNTNTVKVDRLQASFNQRHLSLEVRGEVNNEGQPVDLDNWLLPFDKTLALLEIKQQPAKNGAIELSSPYLVVKLQPHQWRLHPQWGRAIAVGELRKLPGLKVAYRQQDGAIEFTYSLPKNLPQPATTPAPVSLEGLPEVNPPPSSVTAVQQRVNLSGSTSNSVNTQGEFKAVGTVLGSSWYLRVEQPKLGNLLTWGLTDTIVINQSDSTDWIAGSQSPFWRRQGNATGTYWGVTAIARQGFTPPVSLSGGDFVPNERLQSSQIGRTVVGQAQPGTVVRLVRGLTEAVAQVLVDSSGVFRFENVPVSRDAGFGNNYRLLLYPNGQLTADPQVRDVTFTTVPGQLPAGTGAWIASAGVNYNRPADRFIGNFEGAQGGIAYRRGLSESVTVGGGAISDPSALRGLGEVFWQPTGVPLKASISAVTGDRWDVVSSVNYQPSATVSANFNSDRFSSRADLNWLVSPQLTALGKFDSLSGLAIGANYNFSVAPGSNSNIQGTFDSKSFLRWSAYHYQDNWQFGIQGNEVSLNSEVSYRVASAGGSSHSIVASYQTTQAVAPLVPTNFRQVLWRYQSPSLQSELGYGWSGYGQGINASLGTTLAPGLQLLGRYQGVSAFTDRQSFSVEIQSTIDLQGGSQTSTRVEELRTRGGIAIRPFLDRNGNGQPDPGEESYWHPNLITLDNQTPDPSRITKLADRTEIRAAPGSYRLDLHTKHLPPHWRLVSPASIRVNVALGGYTTLPIPLVPTYTVRGIVRDRDGKPLADTAVTATQLPEDRQRRTTVTKADGSYEFSDLPLGAYQLATPGGAPGLLSIVSTSPVLQQLDLRHAPNPIAPQTQSWLPNARGAVFTQLWHGL